MREPTERERRATLRAELLDVLSRYGGQRFVAGPSTERLVQDLTDCVDDAGRARLTLSRQWPPSVGMVFRRGDVQALCLGVRDGRALLAEIVDGVADGAFHDPLIGEERLEYDWVPSWVGDPGRCQPHAGLHVTPHRGCVLR